jgi:putative oxidoreductase
MNNQSTPGLLFSFLFGQYDISKKYVIIPQLLLRIYAGITIMIAGLDKLPLTDWMTEQVTGLGFPFPVFFAWLASFSEFAFGFLLVIGLLTRVSGIFLAITIGVAAFGFHGSLPLIDMHITQYLFWIFVFFAFAGAGRISIDYLIFRKSGETVSKLSYLSIPVLVFLLAFGLYREYSAPEVTYEEPEELQITSVNIAGTFNGWDPASNEMMNVSGNIYQVQVEFDRPSPIEFKFTANKNWDINAGETNQEKTGFPLSGIAEVDEGGNTGNIKAYIPAAGRYIFKVNIENFEYSLDTIP